METTIEVSSNTKFALDSIKDICQLKDYDEVIKYLVEQWKDTE